MTTITHRFTHPVTPRDLRNESTDWTVSVHVYHPSLQSMTRYEVRGDHPVLSGRDEEGAAW